MGPFSKAKVIKYEECIRRLALHDAAVDMSHSALVMSVAENVCQAVSSSNKAVQCSLRDVSDCLFSSRHVEPGPSSSARCLFA